MFKKLALPVIALAMFLLALPVQADDRGHVSEILVKIETADGPRWFKLGKTLTPAEFREGDAVEFDYADDGTIESIAVETEDKPSAIKK